MKEEMEKKSNVSNDSMKITVIKNGPLYRDRWSSPYYLGDFH